MKPTNIAMDKKSGKSCLVCRRRKVRCDRVKPVCLVCVKHGSNMECNYEEQKRDIKFVSMKTPEMSTKIKKRQPEKSSTKSQGNATVVKELDVLKQKVQSLESLLINNITPTEHKVSQSKYSKTVPGSSIDDEFQSLDLSHYKDFNFYQDLETVDVRGGRLSFIGALNCMSMSRVDPYLMTITTLTRKAHHDRSSSFIRYLGNRKYSNLEYIPELAKEVLVAKSSDKNTVMDAMIEIDNDHSEKNKKKRSRETGNSNGEDSSVTSSNDELDNELDDNEKEMTENDVKGQEQREKFARKYLEDQNMDGILTKNNKSSRPSLSEILNHSTLAKSSDVSPESNTSPIPRQAVENTASVPRELNIKKDSLNMRSEVTNNSSSLQSVKNDTPIGFADDETEALYYLNLLLPPARVIWIHVSNYFSSPLNALYPFSTEDWFTDILAGLIGPPSESEDPPVLKVVKKLDFSKIAILFVIMRLSYLMYPSDLEHCSTEEEKYVVSHEIGPVYIEVANLCIRMFNLFRRGVLPVLHCLLLLRVYRRYAPEEGDIADGADSSNFTGLLVQIAESLGMNTDAEKSYQLTNFEIYLHSWRKAWYTIYFLDISEAMNMGNCFAIDTDQFNTKLPTIKKNPNYGMPDFILHPSHEMASVDCCQKNYEFSLYVRDLLKIVMSKRLNTPCNVIMDHINKVERNLKDRYAKSLSSIIALPSSGPQESIEKCNIFRFYVETQSMLLMIQLRLFIHLENNHTDSNSGSFSKPFQLFKKCLSLYIDLEPLLILLFFHDKNDDKNNSYIDKIFGTRTKIIILQTCNHIFVRFQIVLHILLARLLHLYHGYLKNPEPMIKNSEDFLKIKSLVVKIIENALDKLEFANSITQSLSGNQFQAWRLSKGNGFLYSIFKEKNDNIFDPNAPTNLKFQKLSMQRDNFGNNILPDNLNPLKQLPKYNNFLNLELSQFEELYSIINSTRWSIFNSVIDKDKLKAAMNFRSSKQKNPAMSQKKKFRSKGHRSSLTSKSKSSSNNNGHRFSGTPSNSSSDAIDFTPQVSQIKVNEVDTHWFNTILRNNNTYPNWNRDNFERNIAPSGGIPSQSPVVIDANGSFSDFAKSNFTSLDESISTTSFLHENLIQQLQIISGKPSVSFNNNNNNNNNNSKNSIKLTSADNDVEPKYHHSQQKTNFNSIIDSTDLDYLLFNGDI